MEKLQRFKIHAFYVFLLQILSFLVQSSAYTSPIKYFINCGNNIDTAEDGRTFVGDSTSGPLQYTKQGRAVNSNKPAQGSPLYQTARIFEQTSGSYQFDIRTTGIYILRLHFFAFPFSKNLTSASFNVSASGFLLLRASSFLNNTNESPVKEFFIDISKTGKFDIYFVPESSSLAFVNAIELFLAPDIFIPNKASAIDASGNTKIYKGLLSTNVLQTIHRINVGGDVVAPENDTELWRYWVPDDNYLINSDSAEKSPQYADQLYGQDENTDAFATDYVYKTAKEVKSNSSKATWGFPVGKKSKHFVRVHFCDIISQSEDMINFDLYINGNYIESINPYNETTQKATPFHKDFVVDYNDSGLVNITIGLNNNSVVKAAFLNGLEIMKISEELGSVPFIPPNGDKKKMNIFVIVGSVLGGLVFIGIIVLLLFLGLKCKQPKSVDTAVWSVLPGGASTHSKVLEGTIDGSSLGLKIPFVEVKNATKNFSDKLMIGRGGFGKVYKGILKNGMRVAVKRSEPGSGQGLPEFQTEIMVLSKIRHRHLVSLIGYCDERSEMILVYEFMENGTLRDHLYGSKLPCLPWKKRLEICIGAARGLHYLHKGSAGGIIHRDVKSTNILLDEHYEAKVADFGLSRLGPNDESYTHVSTGVKGTFGYLDPEYFRSQQLTEKSDVYSFGVVLLEVLCVRLAINPLLPREQVNLAEWALLCKNKGILEEILDPLIKHEINPNSLRKFAEVAEKCLQEEGVDRPAMSDVMWDLEYALSLQQAAVHREPHEDSTTQSSSMFPTKNVQHLPSLGSDVETDVDWVSKKDMSFSLTSEKLNSAENQ